MKYNLKEMNEYEKPRYKLKSKGVTALNDYELLAIILNTGWKDKSVLDLSIEVCDYLYLNKSISEITLEELTSFKGIGEAKAMLLLSSLELAHRLLEKKNDVFSFHNTLEIYKHYRDELINEVQENLICLYVNVKLEVILKKVINIGSQAQSMIDIKSCIRWGIKVSCAGIVFIHNHPSGDPQPSNYDVFATKKIEEALKMVDIAYIDHLIFGKNAYYSFKEKCIHQVSFNHPDEGFFVNEKVGLKKKINKK